MNEKIKFGFGQIFKTTPDAAKWCFRVVLYIASGLVLIVNTITEIPEPFKLAITKYSMYAVTFVHGFSKMFGISYDDLQAAVTNVKPVEGGKIVSVKVDDDKLKNEP